MADWMTCSACQLRHSRRPDGLCPRCKQPVDSTAAASVPEPPAAIAPSPGLAPLAGQAGLASPSIAGLGRLAQSARSKELKNARGIMLFIGIASVLVNGYFFAAAASNVQAEIDKELKKIRPGFVVDTAKVAQVKEQAVRATRLINAGGMLLGAIFVACGLVVEKHPVPVTVAALALYLGGNAIFAMINPASLAAGAVMKVFIVIALFKAVQAAVAFQKEQAAAAVA